MTDFVFFQLYVSFHVGLHVGYIRSSSILYHAGLQVATKYVFGACNRERMVKWIALRKREYAMSSLIRPRVGAPLFSNQSPAIYQTNPPFFVHSRRPTSPTRMALNAYKMEGGFGWKGKKGGRKGAEGRES